MVAPIVTVREQLRTTVEPIKAPLEEKMRAVLSALRDNLPAAQTIVACWGVAAIFSSVFAGLRADVGGSSVAGAGGGTRPFTRTTPALTATGSPAAPAPDPSR